jgi:hypothetical protein
VRWTVTTPAASWLNRAPRPAGFSAWAFTRQIVYRDSPRPDASCGRSPRHPIRPHSRPRQLKNPRSAFASAKSFVPALRHVAVLWDSTTGSSQLAAIKAGARGLGVELDVLAIRSPASPATPNRQPPREAFETGLAMPPATPAPPDRLESARALCMGCGRPLVGRQKTGCSSRCQAQVSRHRRAAGIRDGLLLLRGQVDDLLARVERRDGGRS